MNWNIIEKIISFNKLKKNVPGCDIIYKTPNPVLFCCCFFKENYNNKDYH